MGGARGKTKRAAAPPCPCPCPGFHLGKILMMTKYPLVTMHMSKCDLLNLIVVKQHRYLWVFLCFQILKTSKFAAFSESPNSKSVLASGGFAH